MQMLFLNHCTTGNGLPVVQHLNSYDPPSSMAPFDRSLTNVGAIAISSMVNGVSGGGEILLISFVEDDLMITSLDIFE